MIPINACTLRITAAAGTELAGAYSSGTVNARGINLGMAFDTAWLESDRGKWNSGCSGEMRRYPEEHQWRRRLPGLILTLRCESVGSKQD